MNIFIFLTLTCLFQNPSQAASQRQGETLPAFEEGSMLVAFVIGPGANVMDTAGPWEVFQDVVVPGRGDDDSDMTPFRLATVSTDKKPVRMTGGFMVVPDYTFDEIPQPQVIVVPALQSSPELLAWLKKAAPESHITFSVCTGAFALARAGLLDGKVATTHHDFRRQLKRLFPKVLVHHDVRYVEGPKIATAAGLTSGIDLSLRIVERYFGTRIAEQTAEYMEHESQAWRVRHGYWDDGNPSEALTNAGPLAVLEGLDPVLLVDGKKEMGKESIDFEHNNYRYVFVDEANRKTFMENPNRYQIQNDGRCSAMSGSAPGSGNPDYFAVHQGRIYIFASQMCRASFVEKPENYLQSSE